MIEISSVTKSFPAVNGSEVVALDEVSLDVERGEFIALIGPSGSGKSTLLFTIGALMKPTNGDVKVFDLDIYQLSAKKRAQIRLSRIGFVFQTFNLVPYLNCEENVAFPLVLSGSSHGKAIKEACDMLERLGLSGREKHLPSQLSVGERQRVALGRSLIQKPEIIIADEPTGNLDPDMTDEVMGLFLELNQSGQTIIMATHDHALAERAGRVVALKNGRIHNGNGNDKCKE